MTLDATDPTFDSALPSCDTCRSLEENRLAQLTFIVGHHALTPVDPCLVEIAITQPGRKPVVEKRRSVGNERLDSLDPNGTERVTLGITFQEDLE